MKKFVAEIPEKIVFGAGVVSEVGKYAKGLGVRAAIITGCSVRAEKTALIAKIQGCLGAENIESFVFAKINENPLMSIVDAGADFAREHGCDFVIGVGGGSSIDAAKVVALLCASGGSVRDYVLDGKYADKQNGELKALPIIAITTTAGTGSEATPWAVVTEPETGKKPGFGWTILYPTVSIVDPELTLTMPKNVTANTGIDVFFHAYEAFVSTIANDFTDIFAVRAMEVAAANLKKCIDNPNDVEARSAMSFANTLAGPAISISGTHIIHGMGHSISGHYNTPHGLALSAIAVAVTEFTWKSDIKKFAKVARILGADAAKDDETLARGCAETMKKFLASVGEDVSLTSIGVTEDMIRVMAEDSFEAMGGNMGVCPVPVTKEDVIAIYKASM
ncbi:MAG: iron-containing alcohol dehydrogenase [Christensenella sp.]